MSLNLALGALAEPNRLKIIELLKKRRMHVSEIALHLQITMPTLSHHLDLLKRANLVSGKRQGQQIFYSLNFHRVTEVLKQLTKLLKVHKNKV
jgi:DNA-binding transcriptional ArsR family regulator